MKTQLSSSSGGFRLRLQLFQMLALSVELRADDLYLVDCLRRIAELAWWPKPVRVGGMSKPELVEACKRQVQLHFTLSAVLAKIERQL